MAEHVHPSRGSPARRGSRTNSIKEPRSFHQKHPNIMWSSRCLLETGTRTPSASAKAAVHHPPALGLEGRQWRTQHTRPAHSASTVQDSRGPRINVGHPQPLPKNQPTAENPNSHFFSHPSSHRLHAPTTSISYFASFASKLWAPQGSAHLQYKVSREERWAKVSPIFPDH